MRENETLSAAFPLFVRLTSTVTAFLLSLGVCNPLRFSYKTLINSIRQCYKLKTFSKTILSNDLLACDKLQLLPKEATS